jgi:hypothetical protein
MSTIQALEISLVVEGRQGGGREIKRDNERQ